MRLRDGTDGLIVAGAALLTVGLGAILWAAFGPLVAAGAANAALGVLLLAVGVLFDLDERRQDRERRRRGETPDVAGRE